MFLNFIVLFLNIGQFCSQSATQFFNAVIKCDVGYVKAHAQQHISTPHYDLVKPQDQEYFPGTALMIAIKYHHLVLLDDLLPEIKYVTKQAIKTQIYIQKYQKKEAIIPAGTSALHYAVYMQDFEAFYQICNYLQQNQLTDYIGMRDDNNLTAVELAIVNHWSLIIPLIKMKPIYLLTQEESVTNIQMPNPLSVSIESGNIHTEKLILQIFNSSQYDIVQDYLEPYDEAQTIEITNIIQYQTFNPKQIQKCENFYFDFCDGKYTEKAEWIERLAQKQTIQVFTQKENEEKQKVWQLKESEREKFLKKQVKKLIQQRKIGEQMQLQEATQQCKAELEQQMLAQDKNIQDGQYLQNGIEPKTLYVPHKRQQSSGSELKNNCIIYPPTLDGTSPGDTEGSSFGSLQYSSFHPEDSQFLNGSQNQLSDLNDSSVLTDELIMSYNMENKIIDTETVSQFDVFY